MLAAVIGGSLCRTTAEISGAAYLPIFISSRWALENWSAAFDLKLSSRYTYVLPNPNSKLRTMHSVRIPNSTLLLRQWIALST